jgi:hypothetical protein
MKKAAFTTNYSQIIRKQGGRDLMQSKEKNITYKALKLEKVADFSSQIVQDKKTIEQL